MENVEIENGSVGRALHRRRRGHAFETQVEAA